jgi:hypothetical protein
VSPGSHAAGDGSFARSTGIQAGRAALLIGAAVVVGALLLRHSPTATPVKVGGTATTGTSQSQTSSSIGGATRPPTTAKSSNPTATAALRAPQDIKVLVANGTSTSGLASRISDRVKGFGYNPLASTNSSQKPASTIIYFQPSYSNDAAALAGRLSLAPTAVQAMPQPPPVTNLNNANILIVVGPDLASSASSASTTSTT